MNNSNERICCPFCGGKTRNRIREDTVLDNFPLYCPKCEREMLIKSIVSGRGQFPTGNMVRAEELTNILQMFSRDVCAPICGFPAYQGYVL